MNSMTKILKNKKVKSRRISKRKIVSFSKVLITCTLVITILIPFATKNIFASGSYENSTYIADLIKDPLNGFVEASFEYGTFPQTEITAENDSATFNTLNSSSVADGYTTTIGSNTYLREDKSGVKHFYKMEPIEWIILRMDDDKLLAITKYAIDAHQFDTVTSKAVRWDGTKGELFSEDMAYPADGSGRFVYPALRLYLNSYDTTYAGYSSTDGSDHPGYSKLIYTPNSSAKFTSRGFYEKAFTDSEKGYIIRDDSERKGLFDGTNECLDYVRIATTAEMGMSTDEESLKLVSKYWFDNVQARGIYSQRIGLSTDYSKNRATNVKSDFVGSNKTDRLCVLTFVKQNSSSNGPSLYDDTWPMFSSYITSNTAYGYRPMITLNYSAFNNLNLKVKMNAGSLEDDYGFVSWYKNGEIDNEHLTDTFETTISDVKNYKARVDFVDNSWTVNGTELTPWHTTNRNEENHGYMYYGSFPKDEITKSNNLSIYNYLNNLSEDALPDGKMIVYDGNKYLRQDKEGGKRFFKVEPIKWSILRYDDGKLLLTSESCLESRSWDSQKTNYVYWDGKGGDEVESKKAYPSLRLYLNSYDTTATYEYVLDDEKTSYSSLNYNPNQFEKFYDKGFLEKAFNTSEEIKITPDHNEDARSLSTDGTQPDDKIRLFGYNETFEHSWLSYYFEDGTGNRYGFQTVLEKTGAISRRLGYINDYSALLYSNIPWNSYDGYDLINRKTEKWWTSTRSNGGVYLVNEIGSANSIYNPEQRLGVRPLMTLDISGLTKVSGDGTFDNPYSFEPRILVSCDDINGEANLDWYPTGATVELTANTISGNNIMGWYDGDTLISSENTYTYTVGTESKELTAKVNVTAEGALNASNSSKETVLSMLSDSRYLSVIDNSDATDNVSDMVSKMRKPSMNELADLIVERRTNNAYENLSEVKTDIKLLADGLNLISGGSGNNKTLTIENYDPKLTYVLQKKTGSKTYIDVGEFTSDTYSITLAESSETYRAVVKCESIEYIYSKDVTLTSSLTLTYDYKGGSGTPLYKELAINGEIGTLPQATKTGYTFGGWFNDDETFTSSVNTSEKLLTDKTIYAKWTPITYKVRYKGNGNTSGSMSEDTFTYDVSGTLKTNTYERKYKVTFNANGGLSEKEFLESSYELSKWNTETDGTGENFEKGASILNLTSTQSDVFNLYAVWTPAAINLPSAERTGYTFGGWYEDEALTSKVGDANFDYTPSQNETLYAKWTPITVTNKLIYETCGGSDGPSTQTYSPSYPSTQSTFTLSGTKPQLAGYTFDWWYTAEEGGVRLGETVTVNEDDSLTGAEKTVYAHYKGIQVDNKIIYDDNGGLNGPGTVTDTVTYPSTQSTFTSSGIIPQKTGCGFAGWFTDPVGGDEVTFPLTVGNANSLIGDSVTVYAHYVEGRYANRLHYDLNGGSNGPADEKVDVTYSDTTCQFTVDSSTIPEKTGFEFIGWFTEETGGVQKEGTIDFGQPHMSEDQTLILYAHYKAKQYTNKLKYDANGGSGAPSDATLNATFPYTVSSFELSKNIPTRLGYTFTGWYTENVGGTKVENSFDVGSMNNADNQEATLYAHWKINEYKLDIDLDGGIVSTSNRVKFNVESETFTLINPSKKGYTFAGWTGTGVDTPQTNVTVSNGTTGDLNFKANWTPNPDADYLVNYYLMKDDKTGYEKKESIVKQAPYENDILISSLAKTFTGYTFEGGKAETATEIKPDIFDDRVTILQDGTTVINIYYSKDPTSGGGGSSGGGGGGGSTRTKIVEVIKEVVKEPEKQTVKERTEYTSYINGYDDGEFKPKRKVTRAEFAKVIASISDDYALKDPSEYTSYVKRYKDVRDNFWNTPYIGYVISNDSMTGYPDGLFKPESYITRAEVCKVLVEIFEIDEVNAENKFADEIKNQWYEQAVDKLVKAGFINGYNDGTFGASRNITRSELVAIINRIRGDILDEKQIEEITKEKGTIYKDIKQKDWFYSDVLAASVTHPVKNESLAGTLIEDTKVAKDLASKIFNK